MSGKHSRCNSKEFYDFDTTYETDRSLEIEEADDVYEMALEVLEADEAFRLQSSGSVSPECDVDRLLENADTERYSGDVTLVRIFSIQQESEVDLMRGSRRLKEKGVATSHEAFDPIHRGSVEAFDLIHRGSDEAFDPIHRGSDEAFDPIHRDSVEAFDPINRGIVVESGKRGTRNSLGGELRAGEPLGDGVGTTVRVSSSEPCVRRRTLLGSSADFASLDDSQHSAESEVFEDPELKKTPSPVVTDFPDGEFLCVARFSNVQSKDAKIRTALTSRSPHRNDTEADSDDVSLHVTSSDSLYSAPDRGFDDPAIVEPTYCGTLNTNTSGDDERFYDRFPASFGFREPSPEDLFDEALETRSDLASSIGSSVHPQGPYFDADCAHRDRTPEDEFDLALETTLHRIQPTSLTPDTLLTGFTDTDNNIQSDLSRLGEYDSSIGADIRRHGHCVSPVESLGSSRDVVSDEHTSTFGHPMDVANASQCSLSFTVDEDVKPADRRYAYLDPWASDCPSSPEPSYLAECSTDDFIGESEGDDSFTDYETPTGTGIDATASKSDFFHRLLSRKEQFDAMELWKESRVVDGEEDVGPASVRICSIEDLLTDSENEGYFGEVGAPSLDERPPVFPRVRAKGPGFDGDGPRRVLAEGDRHEEAPTVALSPPIALAARADIQFARKSKIPKLPESRSDLSPVRISW